MEDVERRSIRHRERPVHRSARAVGEIEADDDLALFRAHTRETSKPRTTLRFGRVPERILDG
jgi:hypothetical protein